MFHQSMPMMNGMGMYHQSISNYHQQPQLQHHQSQQQQMNYNQQQQYFNQNNNHNYIHHTNTFGKQMPIAFPMNNISFCPMPIERKTTFHKKTNDLNINKEWALQAQKQAQIIYNTNSPIKRHFPSSNNINSGNNPRGSQTPKSSIDSSKCLKYTSHFTIDQIEIDEFNAYLTSFKSVCEFLCTQKGAKDMQKVLNKSPMQCKTILINTLEEEMTKIMIDTYGNYFCQELIKTANKEQIILILKYIKKDFIMIAKDYKGTHVLQKILDYIQSKEEKNIILDSIEDNEIDIANDINGTHVLQKIFIKIAENERLKTNEVIFLHLKKLSLNKNGICALKRFISEVKSAEYKEKILTIISDNCLEIAQDSFGNYVIQHLFKTWNTNDYPQIVDIIITNIIMLSMQKFSSNISERIIEKLSPEKRKNYLQELFVPTKLLSVYNNKYGKYVIENIEKCLTDEEREEIKPILKKLKIKLN